MMNMMNMTFHFSDKIPHLLFYQWEIKSWPDMILAIVVAFLIAVVLELLKVLYTRLGLARRKSPLDALQEPMRRRPSSINTHSSSAQQTSPLLSSMRIPSSVSKIKNRRFNFHVIESLLHTLQVALGYMLMLIVMTYNAYLVITIILALTVSYLFLAPIRRMRDPLKVPVRHRSLVTDSEQRSISSSQIVESADTSHMSYGSLYQ